MTVNIQITEFMYSGADDEFIEFTNLGTTTVDMTGWSFDDNTRLSGSFSLSGFGIVQSGESVILTESDAETFRTAWGLGATVKIIGGLTQNLGRSDEINLYDNNGTLIDRLAYGDENISGTVRTQNVSAWTDLANLTTQTIDANWILSVIGDDQNSYASTGGDIGNPGVYNANISFANSPTIQVNTATTNDFLDGGTLNLLPVNGSGAVSGVINDPTDPALLYGIDFTIDDPDNAVGDLTVTVSSDNQSVVSDSNLNLTGSGANRNLKITPNGVGLTNITLRISDGNNSRTYTINYGASASSVNPTTTRFLTGISDASTAIAIDHDYMFVADDEDQTIRLYSRNNSGLPLKAFNFSSSLGLSGNSEVDIEASTKVGNTIYWMGSHSNNSEGLDRPNRERIFATQINGSGVNTTLTFQGYYQFLEDDMIAWDNNNGHGLGAGYLDFGNSAAAGVIPESLDGFNIEGLTFAPDNTTAYVSFRAPNLPTNNRNQALIIPVTNFATILDSTGGISGSAQFGEPIFLDLGGRGIRSIEKNGFNEYIIVAGPADSATGTAPKDFRLYTWTGNPNDTPRIRSANLTGLLADGSFESIVSLASDADFFGQTTFSTSFIPSGNAGLVNGNPTPLGGLSGVTYDAVNNVYYAVSDDRSQIAPARFYSFTTNPSTLETTGVNFTDVTPLKDTNNNFFAINTIDSEGITFTGNGTVFISSEGEISTARVLDPFIKEFSLSTGQEIRSLPIPTKYLPTYNDLNNNSAFNTGEQTSGVRNNLAFESLTISLDRTSLYTATENALFQDGATVTTTSGSPSRILQYNISTGQPEKEYLYVTDSAVPPIGVNQFEHGLVDLLALNDGKLIALERGASFGVGFTIKLYEVDLKPSTDISNINSLSSLTNEQFEAIIPAQKTLLLDISTLNLPNTDGLHPTGLENIEGLTFGADLADGRKSIVLVGDNNFNNLQFTQFISLAYDPLSSDSKIQLLVDNGDSIWYNNGVISKNLAQDNQQKFRSELITLGNVPLNNLNGTSSNDTLIGIEGQNILSGGSGNDSLVGNSLEDTLRGGSGNDTLLGGGGNDILNGGGGHDTMIGGTGNDLYIVNSETDQIIENASEGIDTVRASINYTLDAHLENLILTGTRNINGTGNNLNNLIRGNNGNNELNGNSGDDTLNGNRGNDILNGSTGKDILNGSHGNDSLLGGDDDDIINGGSGNDTLIGGNGNDILTGGGAADIFLFNSSNEGVDTITDFKVTEDTIWINRNDFGGSLPSGILPIIDFVRGSSANNPNHRFIYNPSNGLLSFDADGDGGGSSIELAQLRSGLAFNNTNIIVFDP